MTFNPFSKVQDFFSDIVFPVDQGRQERDLKLLEQTRQLIHEGKSTPRLEEKAKAVTQPIAQIPIGKPVGDFFTDLIEPIKKAVIPDFPLTRPQVREPVKGLVVEPTPEISPEIEEQLKTMGFFDKSSMELLREKGVFDEVRERKRAETLNISDLYSFMYADPRILDDKLIDNLAAGIPYGEALWDAQKTFAKESFTIPVPGGGFMEIPFVASANKIVQAVSKPIRHSIEKKLASSLGSIVKSIFKEIDSKIPNVARQTDEIIKRKFPQLAENEAKNLIEEVVRELIVIQKPVSKFLPPSLVPRGRFPEKITASTTTLLKERLRNMARGAKQAARVERAVGQRQLNVAQRQSIREINAFKKQARKDITQTRILLRSELLDRFRIEKEVSKTTKDEVIDFVKLFIPTSSRGRFLNAVANASTPKNAVKILERVNVVAEAIEKKIELGVLRKNMESIIDSSVIDVKSKAMVRDIFDLINFTKRQSITLEKIKKYKNYIDSQKMKGIDVEMPELILAKVRILDMIPANDLSLKEIRNISDEIEKIAKLGRHKVQSRKNTWELRKDIILNELAEQGLNPISSRAIRENPLEPLSIPAKVKNYILKSLDIASEKLDYSLTFMDDWFDWLDGARGTYDGAIYRHFKGGIDTDWKVFTNMKDEIQNPILRLADELKLNEQNVLRIGIHAAREQENGLQKLITAGLKEEDINAVVLSAPEMKFYQEMREALQKLEEPLAEFLRKNYNRDLSRVKNYFPFLTDWKSMSEIEHYLRFGDTVEEFGQPTKNVAMNFTRTRIDTTGKQTIQLNALDIFLKHTENVSYALSMGERIKMLQEIAKTKKFGSLAGNMGQYYTVEWLDLMARKGGSVGEHQLQWMDNLRKNITYGIMAGKVSSALIQPTALVQGATLIGRWAFKGAGNITQEMVIGGVGKVTKAEKTLPWVDFIRKNMPEVRERIGGEQALIELKGSMLGEGPLQYVREKGLWALKNLDQLTAMSVASGAYEQKLAQLGIPLNFDEPVEEAIMYAQKIVRLTQASGMFKDLPLALSKGKLTGNRSLDKTIFTLQTYPLKAWGLFRHNIIRVMKHHPSPANAYKSANIVLWSTIATGGAVGIRNFTNNSLRKIFGGEEKENDNLVGKTLLELAGTVPFIGQAISIGVYGGEPVPALTFGKEAITGVKGVVTGKKTETKTKAAVQAVGALGVLKGVPFSYQLEQIISGMIQEPNEKELEKLFDTDESFEELEKLYGEETTFEELEKLYQ